MSPASPRSQVNKEDAQEWLESLQQVGEGWYRQVALAVRARAHKALGMERRDFARQIGQRMIDPRQAIIELHNEGHSLSAIADVLGVDRDHTVSRILAEEGLVEWTPYVERRAIEAGHKIGRETAETPEENGRETADTREVESLQAEIEALQIKLQGERRQAEREQDKLRAAAKKLREQLKRAKEEARKAEDTDDQDEVRRRKEAEAWAAEKGRKVLAGLAHLIVDRATTKPHEYGASACALSRCPPLVVRRAPVFSNAVSFADSRRSCLQDRRLLFDFRDSYLL